MASLTISKYSDTALKLPVIGRDGDPFSFSGSKESAFIEKTKFNISNTIILVQFMSILYDVCSASRGAFSPSLKEARDS